MKKSLALTLALVFVLGIAGTAFAANPFVDVPANHWAYGAVKNLAKAGLIDGMSDGTFKGDKEMTRYEMAQIVAKAMAREDKADAANKALIEKLQAEFASELDNLGVRVSNLEKKVGNVTFSGDSRIRYVSKDNAATNPTWGQRLRLNFNATVNDNTTFYGRYMLANHNEFGTPSTAANENQLIDAAFTTKGVFHNTDITVGRYDLNLGQTTYFAGTNGMTDGIQANYNNGKASLMAGYASIKAIGFGSTLATFNNVDNAYYTELNYKFNDDFKMNVNYIKNQVNNSNDDSMKILGVGLTAKVAPNLKLVGDYWKNTADGVKVAANGNNSPKFYVARLAWKGNSAAVPGSWGMAVEYMKADAGSISGDMTGAMVSVGSIDQGVKAWDFQVNYTLAKNITFDGFYQFNMKDPQTGDDLASKNYTRLQVNYMF